MAAKAARSIGMRDLAPGARREALAREWLVTNGLGGYSSGTIGGVGGRRHHPLLVARLPPPFGRRVLLGDFAARVTLANRGRASLRRRQSGILRRFRPGG